jgi:hypothetical protein
MIANQVIETSIDVYRRRVVALTKDRNAARDELAQAISDWRDETRILRAQLAEGTSPRVEALKIELDRLRVENSRLRSALREARSR